MDLDLRPAIPADLAFARELTRINMRDYYVQYAKTWHDEAFDLDWASRQSLIVVNSGKAIGYLSVTKEPGYLYLRDVQLCESCRGAGIGTWLLRQVETLALREGIASIRLKVFKSNPAIELYRRHGYLVIGQEAALFWMERRLSL